MKSRPHALNSSHTSSVVSASRLLAKFLGLANVCVSDSLRFMIYLLRFIGFLMSPQEPDQRFPSNVLLPVLSWEFYYYRLQGLSFSPASCFTATHGSHLMGDTALFCFPGRREGHSRAGLVRFGVSQLRQAQDAALARSLGPAASSRAAFPA